MTAEVHVYGVVGASHAPAAAPAGSRFVTHREVAAVVAELRSAELPAAQALRDHWRIVDELAGETTVLPIRFGTVMASEEAVVEEFLEPNHDALVAGLQHLAGKVQLTVKGAFDEDVLLREVVAGSPAIAQLKAEVDRLPEAASYAQRIQLGQLVATEVEQAREREGALVMERLAPLAVDSRREPASGLDGAVNAAFLVERERMDDFSRAVTELGAELAPRVRLRYVGPLAPFSFAREEVAAWA